MESLPLLLGPAPPNLQALRVLEQPEDFIVEELPLYEPSGAGDHSYFWIEKRGIPSAEAVRRLARLLNKRPPDAGVAGLKDAHAVTRQWISFEHVGAGAGEPRKLDEHITILELKRHGNKLRMGHLKGNRFHLRLRGEEAPQTEITDAIRARLAELQRRGVPNYYGPQRFGRDGASPVLGKLLVQGDEKGFQERLAAGGQRRAAGDRKFRNLMVNAFQAQLFNKVLARRIGGLGELWAGDLAWLHRNGAVFKVLDPAVEQARCDAFEVSPSGPLFGPKMAAPEGRQAALEGAVLDESGVSREDFGRREAERQPGARRALRVTFLEPPLLEETNGGLWLRFALPSGSYATVVVKEVLGERNGGREEIE